MPRKPKQTFPKARSQNCEHHVTYNANENYMEAIQQKSKQKIQRIQQDSLNMISDILSRLNILVIQKIETNPKQN